MFRRWSRKAIYAGTIITTLLIVAGFSIATIYPSSAFNQTGRQSVVKDVKGVHLYGAGFMVAFLTLSAPPFTLTLCNGGTCSSSASETVPINGVKTGNMTAYTFANFSASSGVPAQEQYFVDFGISGVGDFFMIVETPTTLSGHWTPTSDDFVSFWVDLGTFTTPLTTINVVISDFGPY